MEIEVPVGRGGGVHTMEKKVLSVVHVIGLLYSPCQQRVMVFSLFFSSVKGAT